VLAVAERHVVVGRAADVEALRLGEHVLVAVRRRIPEDQLRVLRDLLAADLALLRRGAPERVHRGRVAQDLSVESITEVVPACAALRILERLIILLVVMVRVSRCWHQHEEEVELPGGEQAVELCVHESGGEIVGRMGDLLRSFAAYMNIPIMACYTGAGLLPG
jgi:hypothetical protein